MNPFRRLDGVTAVNRDGCAILAEKGAKGAKFGVMQCFALHNPKFRLLPPAPRSGVGYGENDIVQWGVTV